MYSFIIYNFIETQDNIWLQSFAKFFQYFGNKNSLTLLLQGSILFHFSYLIPAEKDVLTPYEITLLDKENIIPIVYREQPLSMNFIQVDQ